MQISDIMAREVAFALFDVVGVEDLSALPRFASHNRETYEAVLETARKIADDYFARTTARAISMNPGWSMAWSS